jgi:hypothetical protein
MRRRATVAFLVLFGAAGVARGQEAAADCNDPKPAVEPESCPVPTDDGSGGFQHEVPVPPTFDGRELAPVDDRPQIQVLQHPYDLASFYRADGQQPGFYDRAAGRYPISGYYRGAMSPRGYSRFWNTGYGYGARNGSTVMMVPGAGYDYRRRIGENGDLFLMAPILAPVGPLSDVFFSVGAR